MIPKPLGTIAIVIAGQSPPSSTYNSLGYGLPFFQGKADFQETYPKVRIWSTSTQRKEAKPGDILISVRAPVGAVNICNQKSIIGRGLSAIRPMSSLDGKFLYYYLKANEKQIDALGTGSTFKAITQDTLKKVSVPLPTLDDQKRIAHLLGKVEGAIAQRKQHLQQLNDLIKSVFWEMFGDPARNEKSWDIIQLGLISEVQGGLQVTSKRKTHPIEVPYLRVANVYRDRLNLTEIKNLRVTEAELERVILKKGDLLIVEGHGNPLEIGRSSVWDGSIDNCVHQNHLIRVRVDASKMTELYTSHFINSPVGRSQMFRAGKTTSGLNTISSKNVKEIEVLMPPIPLQTKFATIVEKVEVIKSHYQQSLTDLETLYGALSQKAFKGELDLSRVPLIPKVTESTAEENPERDELPQAMNTFNLPAPSNLATLNSTEGRSALLDQWLTIWFKHLSKMPFSTQSFIGAAQQRFWELAEDNALEWELGAAEYDYVRAWIFESLDEEHLTQTYDNANNNVQLIVAGT